MKVSQNLAAGLVGSVGTTLVGLVVVPLYLRLLGLEAYGVVGFFTTVLSLLQVFELGLGPALNREVARRRAQGRLAEAGRLLHALAALTWAVGLALGAGLALAAPALAGGWLRSRDLPVETVTRAVAAMGLVVACRWPVALYQAVLLGAERQVLSSALSLGANAVAGLGAAAVLALAAPSLPALFLWQAGAWLLAALATRRAAWRVLGPHPGPRLEAGELRGVWRFSAALTVISVQAIALSHLDKAVLSRLLTLDQFGGYALASTVASGLYLVVTPFSTALYPRFTALLATGDLATLASVYRVGTRLLAVGLFPLAAVLVFFGADVVQAWTGDAALAAALAPVVAALAGGSALHGVLYLQYSLQLAAGETRLPLLINTALLAALVPLLVVLTGWAGALGGALAWLALHLLYLGLGTWLTHRRLLPGLAARWLALEVGLPLVASLLAGLGGRALASALGWSGWPALAPAAATALAAGALGLAASPELRDALRTEWRAHRAGRAPPA